MAEWKIRRGEQEFTAPDTATLQQWAASGRVVGSDYVLNPTLQRWMYASEVAELSVAVQPPRGKSAARGACGLAIALFLFAVMLGMFGMGESFAVLLGAGAFVFAIVAGVLYVLKR